MFVFKRAIRDEQVRSARFGLVLASWAMLPACFLALACASCSEKQSTFSVEAKVTMRDGSSVEVMDFALIGTRTFEPSGTYTYLQQSLTSDVDLPVHIYGYSWRELPIAEVDSAVLEPVRKNVSSWYLFRASIKMKDGEEVAGEIPADPDLSWHRAQYFLVRGRSVELSPEAAIEIPFREVRKFEAKDGSTWTLTDEKGMKYDVQDLRLSTFWSAPFRREVCYWKPTTAGNLYLSVKTGDSDAQIPLFKTKRLQITRYNDPVSVLATARDGGEVSGVVKIEDCGFLFGRTRDKRTWFGPFLGVREIEFATPRRKTWSD